MTSQTGQAHTHTTHGGHSQDSHGPQPVRAAPASHAMYIHIAGGLPGPRSAVCASEQRQSAAAPRRGCWGLPPRPRAGSTLATGGTRRKNGAGLAWGLRLGGARGTQCPAVRFGRAHGLRRKAQGPETTRGTPVFACSLPSLPGAGVCPRSGTEVAWPPAHPPFWSQTPAQREDCGGRAGGPSPGLSRGRAAPPLWKEEPTRLAAAWPAAHLPLQDPGPGPPVWLPVLYCCPWLDTQARASLFQAG